MAGGGSGAAGGVLEEDDGPGEGSDGERDDPEVESQEAAGEAPAGHRYSADISDAELERRWVEDPASLGSLAVGFTHAGRMINAEPFPEGEGWTVVSPQHAWALRETIDYMTTALRAVHARFPDGPSIRVNHISRRDGGHLRPHRSHQAGRDVDLSFYYRADAPPGLHRKDRMDLARNWALIRALVTLTDVQVILVDRQIQKVIYDYALRAGENRAWLDSLFRAGHDSIVRHARRHRDHFHVRFYAPRSQELGRRILPLLARQPEQNLAMHRVRSGDTLGAIALRYNSSVRAIRRANGMRSNLISIGRVLKVPLRGPCTRCPVPPEVIVPARRLPPEGPVASSLQGTTSPSATAPRTSSPPRAS